MHKTSKPVRSIATLLAGIALFLLAACNVSGLPESVRNAPTPIALISAGTATVTRPGIPTATPTPPTEPPTASSTARGVSPTATNAQTLLGTPTSASQTESPTVVATSDTRATQQPISTATVDPGETVLPQSEREEIFNQVWDTVNNNYLYPDFHGADWNALKAKYEPIAVSATSSDQFYQAITDMVAELKDDHSRYLSPVAAKDEDDLESGHADYVGIGVLSSPEDKSVRVIYVFPNSPAEKAGLKRRDRIVALNGKPFTDPGTEIAQVRGAAGTTVTLTVVSPEQDEREVAIVRGQVTGAVAPSSMRLAGNPDMGYLIIPNLWTDDMDTRVEGELNRLLADKLPLKGLVIDMRGNGGGFRTVLESILGDFVTGKVGTFFNQTQSYGLTIVANSIASRLKDVPVVVLVDKGTESYAEVLSASIQEKGRAKIVGVPSAGNTETIFAYDLKDGSRLWCAQEGFKLNDGTNMEGRGVIPDVTIDQDWTAFTDDDDPQILKAVELLQNEQPAP